MTDRETHLRHILENPSDILARLTYADRLEEDGDPCRAAVIRCSVSMSRFTDCPARMTAIGFDGHRSMRCGSCEYCECRRFVEDYRGDMMPGIDHAWSVEPTPFDIPPESVNGPLFTLKDGFFSSCRCRLEWWVGGDCHCLTWAREFRHESLGHPQCESCFGVGRRPENGRTVLAAHPVIRVDVVGREPLAATRSVIAYDPELGRIRDVERVVEGVNDVGELGEYFFRRNDVVTLFDRDAVTHDLPSVVFGELPDRKTYDTHPHLAFYPSREAGGDALSEAMLRVARKPKGAT